MEPGKESPPRAALGARHAARRRTAGRKSLPTAGLWPPRDRVIESDCVAAVEPHDKRRLSRECRDRLREPEIADRAEIARTLVGQHQRHAIHDQRLDDAGDQPLTEADDVEVAVEIAREPD